MGRRLRELLAENRLVRVFGMGQLCDPKLIEMIGREGGYDAVWLDQEHAGLTIERIEQAARGARIAGIDSFVRLAPTDYATVMRPLEAGAGGIMAAQVRGVRQAEEVVRWARFFPQGLRGVNGTGVDGDYGNLPINQYLEKANAESFLAIQIEHIDAVNEVEEIAALKHVDVLFIGPADLGQSMGLVGEWNHPRMWQAVERVAHAAKEHGVHWAILPPSVAFAQRCVELGCKMLSLGLDTWAFQRGIRDFKKEYEGVS